MKHTLCSEFTLLVKAKLALTKARIVNYNKFVVQPTVIRVVNYDHNRFIIQATGIIIAGEVRSGVLKLYF